MAPRPYWKGQIRLALVSIPVEIFTATKSGAAISLNQIHEPTGKRIRYEKVVPGVGAVDADEIVKGYEYEKDSYVILEEDEMEAVKLESKKTLHLTQFVDAHEIDVLYFEKPYYVVPADDLAEEAYIVLREALRRTKKVAIGQLTLRGREHVVTLKPCGSGIVLETLRYADEVQSAQRYFGDIPDEAPDEELLDLAETLIEKKTAKFDPKKFHDRYIDALRELIERKREGGTIQAEEEDVAPSRGSNVIDLMAVLKKSIEKPDSEASEEKSAPKKSPAKKPPARRSRSKPEPARKSA